MTHVEEKELMLYLRMRERIFKTRRYADESLDAFNKRIAPHLQDAEAMHLVRLTHITV